MNLSAIARPTCSWCNGTGAYTDGRPCILCSGQRLSRAQQRWRVETRHGMAYDNGDWLPPRDTAREAEEARWRHTRRNRGGAYG